MAAATPLDKATLARLFTEDFILGGKGTTQGSITEKYSAMETLGEGQFGIVRRVVDKASGAAFACKSMPKRQIRYAEELDDIRREIAVLRHLADCPHIVSVREIYEDRHAIYIVMELCTGGELFERIVQRRNYSERAAADIMRTMLTVSRKVEKWKEK